MRFNEDTQVKREQLLDFLEKKISNLSVLSAL